MSRISARANWLSSHVKKLVVSLLKQNPSKVIRVVNPTEVHWSNRPHWAREAESAVGRPREITALPPATVDSFPTSATRRGKNRLHVAFALVLMLSLSGCTDPSGAQAGATNMASEPTAQSNGPVPQAIASPETPSVSETQAPKEAAEQPKPSVQPTEEPKPKVSKEAEFGGVAFELGKSKLGSIERQSEKVSDSHRIASEIDKNGKIAKFADGVKLSLAEAKPGTVKSEGPGYFTGASYRAFEITVQNDSDQALDLTTVFVNLVLGKAEDMAMPLYGEIEAYDFAAILDAGQSATSTYAFIVPEGTKKATLHIDVDATHQPVVFEIGNK